MNRSGTGNGSTLNGVGTRNAVAIVVWSIILIFVFAWLTVKEAYNRKLFVTRR